MPTLAFDTSTGTAAVALLDGETTVQRESPPGAARHGETLLPLIADVLAAAGHSLEDVELVAVGAGPGSFTGLRIGLATAQGLQLARGTRAVGVCSLRALATPQVVAHGGPVAAVLDAFRGEVYVAVYAPGDKSEAAPRELVPPFGAAPEAAIARLLAAVPGGLRCVGDGLVRHREAFEADPSGRLLLAPEHAVPCAVSLGRYAEHLRATGQLPADGAPQPIYLRGADAKLPDRPLKL